jgi:hypothetical protein
MRVPMDQRSLLAAVVAFLCVTCGLCAEPPMPKPSPQPVRLRAFELKDQFGKAQRFQIPLPQVTVLTVADRKGSEQLGGWVKKLKEHYGGRLSILGVADVTKVPAMMRPLVRSRFKQRYEHSILLDWEGVCSRQLTVVADQANLFVLGTNGVVTLTLNGSCDDAKLRQLFGAIGTSHTLGQPYGDQPATSR